MWRAFRRSEKNECFKTRELLSGYVDQRLNSEEVAHVEGHLGTCPGCREEMESLRATVALLHRLPEVTPSRSFAVSPVRPLPGRRALPALRFATAGVVLLLVLAFAADGAGLFEGGILSNPKAGPAYNFGADTGSAEEGESYWVVAGVANNIQIDSVTQVDLVVPDGSDNVVAAVDLLASGDAIYGNLVAEQDQDDVPQLVLMEGETEAVSRGDATQFTVVSDSCETQNRFAPNDAAVPSAAINSVMKDQVGPYLNILSSDNNVLYSFRVDQAQREVKVAGNNDWLRPLEYGLIGLAVVLGAAAVALWLRQRRARAVEVS